MKGAAPSRSPNTMAEGFGLFYLGVLLFVASVGASGQPHLLGGPQDVDMNNNQGAKDALCYAVQQHNLNSTDSHLRDVSEVVKAQCQVVQGFRYIFTVIMGKTNCTKPAFANEVCIIPPELDNTQTYTCTFTVWSRPWLNSTIVTEKCPPAESCNFL